MRSLSFIPAAILASTFIAAAAQQPTGQQPGKVPPMLQQGYSEQREQEMLGAFFKRLREESLPMVKSGNVLGQIELLRKLRGEFKESRGVRDASGQLLGTLLSFLGRPREAQELFDNLPHDSSQPKRKAPSPPEAFAPVAAVDAIARAAADRRAVFVNEAHHVPQHRLLTLALLARLREQGYRYFAAETFSQEDPALNDRDYAVNSTGFYSNEPLFAQVVREARRLGYTLVPYEAKTPASQDERERGQAQNLKERIFDKDPQAKVLVHAGYAHIEESGLLGDAPPMAMRFRELTGIDPLTVDQTMMTERTRPELEVGTYRELEAKFKFSEPTLFTVEGELWSARPGVVDATVFRPRTEYRKGRPGWLFALGRSEVPVPTEFCVTVSPCVVEARVAEEPPDAVPVDALMIDKPGDAIVLALPVGRYRIDAKNASGKIHKSHIGTVHN